MDEIPIELIKERIKKGQFVISRHARSRMFERNISTEELEKILLKDEIIEDYYNDKPCPAVLLLSFLHSVAFHIVTGICGDHIRVITIYNPEPDKWVDNTIRK